VRMQWAASVLVVGAMMTSLLAQGAPRQPQPREEPRTPSAEVALTFDDLPAHGPIPAGSSRVDIAQRIIEQLRAYQAPPIYGFVNAKDLTEHPEDAQVLRVWRDAGFPLGNHAFSHMDLHANSAEAFEQDVLANEATLRTYMEGQDWHWLRFPYLREGDTPEKYHAVRAFLAAHGYHVAQVTLSFDDYAYNEPYARCLAKQDTKAIAWLEESFLTRAGESLTRGQEASRTLFQRDIPHVMLLHIGGFETVMLAQLLHLLQARGFVLTTLPAAARDPAYAEDPKLPANWNGTFLQQLLRARQPPPAAPAPPAGSGIFEKLATLCR
jgi:peptidoglycan/xylan/chitin deacetylase (PgdA/CDA1 family)